MAASSSSGSASFQYSNATRITSNVSISVERGGAYFGVAAPKDPNILSDIVAVIKKYDLVVKSGCTSQEKSKDLYVIYAKDAREGISEAIPLGYICRMAAKEIERELLSS